MEVAEPPESQEACFAFNSDIIFSSLISKGIIFDEHIQQSSCTLGLSKIFVQDDLDRYLPTLKTLRIPFHSGMNINIFILTSIAWLWTIFQSWVSFCHACSCQFSSSTEMKFKLHLYTLNMYLVKAKFCSPISIVGSLSNQHVHLCVLEFGACWGM